MNYIAAASLVVLSTLVAIAQSGPCLSRSYGHGSVVCVCDPDQCGALSPLPSLRGPEGPGPAAEDGSFTPFMLFTSSKAGLRLHRANGNFTSGYAPPPSSRVGDAVDGADRADRVTDDDERLMWTRGAVRMSVDALTKYQRVEGFGGAITDSAAINIHKMGPATRDVLMRALFGADGNAYKLIRVPMGGTDDSVRKYTYVDTPGDTDELQNFRLPDEDVKYKIPVLLNASALSEGALRVIASAWTAPPWMKTNGQFVGGVLRREMYQAWADYHVRFVSEYTSRGVPVWALTTGNEPINAFFTPFMIRFNSMGWTPALHRGWIGRHLAPTLRRSAFNATKLLCLDDQRMLLPWWLDILFRDPVVKDYIDGIAVHWYWDIVDPRLGLEATHKRYPDKFLLSTEASNADKPWQLDKVQLGSWTRGEKYMMDILKDMNSWVTAWMEWSLVLDKQGGPTWSGNFVDAGVIVDTARDEILLQPMYFAMAHFSRFVPVGSRRVRLQLDRGSGVAAGGAPSDEQVLSGRSQVDAIAFLTPQDDVVVVMHNAGDSDSTVTVRDPRIGVASVVLQARSFNTMVYSAVQE